MSPRASFIALLALPIIALSSLDALAQTRVETRPLLVGVFDAPPFSMKLEDGSWGGMSVELWEAVADRHGWAYEFRAYDSLAPLREAVRVGEVDVTPALASVPEYEVAMDLSHSYYPSGSGIAVPESVTGFRWLGIVEQVISWHFLRLIVLLLLVWLTAGAAVWLFERRRNGGTFGTRPVEGLGNGVWWAAVTMTTVGYGDKAPRTLGGRAVAIVWMLTSIIFISSFTAAITTSLTLNGLTGIVREVTDLRALRVGATADSRSFRFLEEHGIAVLPFVHERDGLSAVADGRIDAFAFNDLVLRHLARTEFLGRVRVLPITFDRYYTKMGMPTGSPLREPINRALLEIVQSREWRRRIQRYIGPEH